MPSREAEVRGLFTDPAAARRAGRELVLAGFPDDQVKMGERRGGLFDALLGDDASRGTLVQVQPGGRALEAAAILHRHGGRDPEEGEPSGAAEAESREADREGGVQLELVTEDLVPRFEPVQIGEVRLVKRVVTEKRTIEVEVRREEVSVEHHPAPEPPPAVRFEDADADPETEAYSGVADAARLDEEEQVTRVPVFAEQVVVIKRPFVVEEVWIRKHSIVEKRAASGDIRREELEVEPVGDVVVESDAAGTTVVRPKPRRAPSRANQAGR